MWIHNSDTPHKNGQDHTLTLLLHFEFASVQGSVLLSESEDLANLLLAMNALKALPWFPKVVRDIRAFRVEQWSDFTGFMKA
jgi:virulence-associated protein VapD